MKKILTALAISFSALMATSLSTAAPHSDQERGGYSSRQAPDFRMREMHNVDDEHPQERRMREERGVKRLQQHKWQTGYVMPQHYRGNGYKVEYKEHNLPKPERKQQWYKVNNDYILVNSESNSIVRILAF